MACFKTIKEGDSYSIHIQAFHSTLTIEKNYKKFKNKKKSNLNTFLKKFKLLLLYKINIFIN